MTEQFFSDVLFGTTASPGARVFLRRVFPIQDECNERLDRLVVSEAILGDSLSHIDDCHVLVIQEGGHVNGIDYDKYIISKIREITVRFEPRPESDEKLASVDLPLDPKLSIESVLAKLGETLSLEVDCLDLYKCYSTKSMMKRPAEFPVELETEKNLESLLEWCKEGRKTVYYRLSSDSRKVAASSPVQRPDQGALPQHPPLPSLPASPQTAEKPDPAFSVEEDIMDTA